MNAKETLETVLSGATLTREDAATFLRDVLEGEVAPEVLAGTLGGLRTRGETTDEFLGFLDVLLERAVKVPFSGGRLLDTCGTGGDGLGTFNISTAAGIVVAAAGIPVAKHGNRSVSSKSGSSDVLEAAGVHLTGDVDVLAKSLEKLGLAFLFAPFHHPALKVVAPVRKAMGVMTIFNQLGPLVNPAPVTHQYVGVSKPTALDRYGEILHARGIRASIVHGRDGADEALPGGPFTLVRVHPSADGPVRSVLYPGDFGCPDWPTSAFGGGDAKANAKLLWALLDGEGPAPLREAIALNAGLAIDLAEAEATPQLGIERARKVLASGDAGRLLRAYRDLVG